MKLTLSNIFKFLFFLGLGLLLIWLAVRNLTDDDVENIKNAFTEANYFWIFASIVLSVLSHISRCIRWRILLEPLGHKPSLLNIFFALMIGYMANFALPRLGEVSRCGVLTKYEKIPFTQAFGTVVAERFIDLIGLIIIFIATLYFQFDKLWTLSNELIITPIKEKVTGLIDSEYGFLFLGAGVLLFLAITFFVKRKKKNTPLKEGEIGLAEGFINGLKTVKDIKKPFQFIFHSVLIWLLYVGALQVGFSCFEETSTLGIDAGFAVLIFSTIGVMLTPGGTGASQVLITKALTSVFGITLTYAFAISWLIWSAQFVVLLLLGVISLILLPLLNKENV